MYIYTYTIGIAFHINRIFCIYLLYTMVLNIQIYLCKHMYVQYYICINIIYMYVQLRLRRKQYIYKYVYCIYHTQVHFICNCFKSTSKILSNMNVLRKQKKTYAPAADNIYMYKYYIYIYI